MTNLKLLPKLLLLLLLLGLRAAFAQSPNAPLLTTFSNPIPFIQGDPAYFGSRVAAVGSDRVIIGAYYAGTAYLFRTDGTLLTTFTDPTPAASDGYGISVAAVGNDRVLIGAFGDDTAAFASGAAYLFSTDGTLLKTFTKPAATGEEQFGFAVAAVGSDRVLIGAPADNTGAVQTGAAYLFSTNGTLLTTFTNPTPGVAENFGKSLAAVGNDRVLIGKSGYGARPGAYLFSTNGNLLTTFTNPVPMAGVTFGPSVTSVGSDRVIIISTDNNLGKAVGVYLFGTNGTLLTTFTNPVPAANSYFGGSVAAVGSSRVLIGDSGLNAVGVAYLFSTNGTLLNTITNPNPAAINFGAAVVAVGKDQVIIGAADAPGAAQAGAAYLFALPYPPLSIARNGSAASMKWITPETGLALEQTDALGTSPVWSNTTNSVSINGLTNVVQQTMATTNRFFRLRRP